VTLQGDNIMELIRSDRIGLEETLLSPLMRNSLLIDRFIAS